MIDPHEQIDKLVEKTSGSFGGLCGACINHERVEDLTLLSVIDTLCGWREESRTEDLRRVTFLVGGILRAIPTTDPPPRNKEDHR